MSLGVRATAVVTIVAVSLFGWRDAALQSQSGVIALTPNLASPPPFEIFQVHVGPGPQGNPSAGPDLVAYVDGFVPVVIRYFRFSTGAIESIPIEDSFADFPASVSGDRIAFVRALPDGNPILVYDTRDATTTRVPAVTTGTDMLALGGNILATIEFVSPFADLLAYDLATGATHLVAVDDTTASQKPDVAPDGKLIVWEQCARFLTNCDVRAAAWNASTSQFVGRTIMETSEPEANPDTDGTWIVYDGGNRNGATGEDIYFTSAAGGPIQQIVLPGRQFSPSVSNGVIAFVSAASGGAADVFAYEIATNRLYPITATPAISEDLPDTAAAPNGSVRIAWTTNSSVFDEMDIYAATLVVPQSPTYKVKLGYKSDELVKRPPHFFMIKLEIHDAGGKNVSGPGLEVVAVSLTHIPTGKTYLIDDQGNSNPDFKFSFKSDTLSYTYNLSTAALPAGSYVMKVAVGPEGVLLDVPFALQ